MARVGAEDATATAELIMDITGQPKLDISGREGLVSTRASAGKETFGAGRDHQYRHCAGGRGRAQRLGAERLEDHVRAEDRSTASRPNETKEVQALITPTEKAIAGDYVTTVRASARGESASATFRVTVTTSTMWGIAGVGIIGVALLVMVGAVARFGRR